MTALFDETKKILSETLFDRLTTLPRMGDTPYVHPNCTALSMLMILQKADIDTLWSLVLQLIHY
jgi:hypothetical protein